MKTLRNDIKQDVSRLKTKFDAGMKAIKSDLSEIKFLMKLLTLQLSFALIGVGFLIFKAFFA
jgi:hypothetical protein